MNISGTTSNVISPLVHMKVLSPNDYMSLTLVLLHSVVFFLFQDFLSELHAKLPENLLLKFFICLSPFRFGVSFRHTHLCILMGQSSVMTPMHNL